TDDCEGQRDAVLAEDLVTLWVAAAVPGQAGWRGDELGAATRAATLSDRPIQATDPRVNAGEGRRNELNRVALVDGCAVPYIGGPRESCDHIRTEHIGEGRRLLHNGIIPLEQTGVVQPPNQTILLILPCTRSSITSAAIKLGGGKAAWPTTTTSTGSREVRIPQRVATVRCPSRLIALPAILPLRRGACLGLRSLLCVGR